jgi:hypothetical protein
LQFTAHNGFVNGGNDTSGSPTSGDAIQTFTLVVNQAPAFTSAASTTFTVGTPGSFAVAASGFALGTDGFPALDIAENAGDMLPAGVTVRLNSGQTLNTSTLLISGIPAAGQAGTYTLHFTAHNGVGSDATQTFSLTVM